MADPKKRQKRQGPYLATAVFCDTILEGSDRVLSAVRIVDHVTVGIRVDAPSDIPSEEKRVPVSVWSLITFKRGYGKRKHVARFVMESPSGTKKEMLKQSVVFGQEPHGGANLRIRVNILAQEEGIYWLDVILDEKLMTSMPLKVSVSRSLEIPDLPPTPKLTKQS